MPIPHKDEIRRKEKGLPPIDVLELPKIKPLTCKWNAEGFAYRELFVRLPESITLQMMNDEPRIWRSVQGDIHTALMKFDRVVAIAFDESWMIDAVVNVAARDSVMLAGIRKISLPQRSVALYADETYRVKWAGSGYGVFRLADDVMMLSETYQTPEAAKMGLMSLYPKAKRA